MIAGSGPLGGADSTPGPPSERETASSPGDHHLSALTHARRAVAPWLGLTHPAQQVRPPHSVCGGAGRGVTAGRCVTSRAAGDLRWLRPVTRESWRSMAGASRSSGRSRRCRRVDGTEAARAAATTGAVRQRGPRHPPQRRQHPAVRPVGDPPPGARARATCRWLRSVDPARAERWQWASPWSGWLRRQSPRADETELAPAAADHLGSCSGDGGPAGRGTPWVIPSRSSVMHAYGRRPSGWARHATPRPAGHIGGAGAAHEPSGAAHAPGRPAG